MPSNDDVAFKVWYAEQARKYGLNRIQTTRVTFTITDPHGGLDLNQTRADTGHRNLK